MRTGERVFAAAIVLVAIGLLTENRPTSTSSAAARDRAQPGVRLTMDQLHQQGGVPLGWQMTLPPGDVGAGRRAFIDLGCPSCHAVAGAESSGAGANPPGPELSGMGKHHPAAYFAEAILNPDAVLIEGPGYIGADGHSTMPAYPELTALQLADLVAYLASLDRGSPQSCHDGATAASALTRLERGDRPRDEAPVPRRYFTQSFDILPGQLDAFAAWFAARGRPQFLAVPGLESVDTFVDATRPGGALTTVLAFRDEVALRNFLGDPASADLWREFDAFVGPHGHVLSDLPPVYRVPGLSGRRED